MTTSVEPHVLVIKNLPKRKAHRFTFSPDGDQLQQIATRLGVLSVRKLALTGQIQAQDKGRWSMETQLGATVDQACVVTLEPVRTRVECEGQRFFAPDQAVDTAASEVEMASDDTDPLPDQIDLLDIATEILSLEMPDFPRSDAAEASQWTYAEQGVTPMSDQDAKPFAALAGLKQKLTNADQDK